VLIACACIPTLGPLFKLLQDKDFKRAFRAVSQYWKSTDRSDHMALKDYDSLGKAKGSNAKFSDAGQDIDSFERGFYHPTKISAV